MRRSTLHDIPAEGEAWLRAYFARGRWRQLVWRLLSNLIDHNAARTASAMAFDLFLAFIPMLAFTGWMVGHVLHASEGALLSGSLLFDITPKQMHELLARHLSRLEATRLAPLAALSGWWLASAAFHTLISVYEEAFKISPRSWLKTRAIALGCALLAVCSLSLSGTIGLVAAASAGNPFAQGLLGPMETLGLGKWFGIGVALLVTTGFFSLLFQVSVRRKRGMRRHVVPGAAIAVLLGALSTLGFGYYAAQLGRFALFYGSLAAVAITMAWLWLWCLATLLGAEVNVLIENLDRERTLADSHRRSEVPHV